MARWFSPLAVLVAAVVLTACASVPTHEEIQTQFDSGLKQYDAGDYKGAYKTWHDIESVDVAALRNVALMLRRGQGVEKNPKAAAEKMARAADIGLVTAQADLGEMFLSGEIGPRDAKSAVPWLGRAAAAGHPLAAFELGQLYENGDGVDKDLEAARKLYTVAAKAGVAGAAERLQGLPPPSPPSDQPAGPAPAQSSASPGALAPSISL